MTQLIAPCFSCFVNPFPCAPSRMTYLINSSELLAHLPSILPLVIEVVVSSLKSFCYASSALLLAHIDQLGIFWGMPCRHLGP